MFTVALLLIFSAYFVGGIVMKKLQGRSTPGNWLPNHQFWSSLHGLVVDGVSYTVHGGKQQRMKPEALLPSPETEPESTTLQVNTPRNAEPASRTEPLFTEYVEKYGNENQQQLKSALEQQGTTASKLGVKQLEMLVLKQQLQKLGLPTTGTKADLEARMRVASVATAATPSVQPQSTGSPTNS